MPIYAYRCTTCGHAKDVLQKMSDALLTVCPSCGADTFVKQVTAAGFQLKGSGWYVTDFRGGNGANGVAVAPAGEAGKTDSTTGSTAAGSEKSGADTGTSGTSGQSTGTAAAPASPPVTPTKGP